MSAFTEAVEHQCEGLGHVSVGLCEGCETCGEFDPDAGDEGHFSWSSCDTCGSTLGGQRFASHALLPNPDGSFVGAEMIHMGSCTDCLVFFANGDEPEE